MKKWWSIFGIALLCYLAGFWICTYIFNERGIFGTIFGGIGAIGFIVAIISFIVAVVLSARTLFGSYSSDTSSRSPAPTSPQSYGNHSGDISSRSPAPTSSQSSDLLSTEEAIRAYERILNDQNSNFQQKMLAKPILEELRDY